MIETVAFNPVDTTPERPRSENRLDGTLSPFPRHAPDDPTVLAQLYGMHIDEE